MLRLSIRKCCRLTAKYLKELIGFPYRLSRIHSELIEAKAQLNRVSQITANYSATMSSQNNLVKDSCAIMTVLIMRENVAFLDEWVNHHLQLGVDHVFIYDNSMSEYDNAIGCAISGGRGGAAINKHRVDYASILGDRSSDEFIKNEVQRLCRKYSGRLTIVPWARRDENGIVCYFQKEAIIDFVLNNRSRFAYGLAIDTDEFLISDVGWTISDLIDEMARRGVSTGLIGQRRVLYRFCNVDAPVRAIPWVLHRDAGSVDYGACKSIFRLDLFTGCCEDFIVHYIPTLLGTARFDWKRMRFHHYGWPGFRERRTLEELNESEQKFLLSEFRRDESMFRYLNVDGQ